MPDATAGIASGLYGVATGRTPMDDLDKDDDELKSKPEDDDPDLPLKDRKP